jgi:glycosyltransferase involved in cell wall biosynthesis
LTTVLLDATYAARASSSGTAVYVNELVRALGALDGVEVRAVRNPRRRPPAGGGIGSVRNLVVDAAWTSLALPRLARASGADVIHHPLPAVPPVRAAVAQVLTVHDLAFERHPELFHPRFRAFAHHSHRLAARRADAIVCVSEATAADVQELWGVPGDRIVVARHGPGQALPSVPRRDEGRYYLYVGDDEPRKDVRTLLAAHALVRERLAEAPQLLLAGTVGAPAVPGVRCEASPGAARLADLYAGALALVHPARHEGFGLTLVEAMGAGVPVIAARCAAAVEVCDGAARWVAPGDAETLAQAMIELSRDSVERDRLREAGRARAADFDWLASARAHAAAYSLALRAGR